MKVNRYLPLAAVAVVLHLDCRAAVRFVNVDSGSPVSPFLSWETAARSIQDAVDAAEVDDEVVVTNGVYATGGRAVYGTMTNRVAINKGVTVRSVNGPSLTFIVGQGVGDGGTNNGDGALRCVYVGTNAVLCGFTLTNGHTRATGEISREQNGGGAFCEATAVLTNCILIGNSARNGGGGVYRGILYNCILARNRGGMGGGGLDAWLNSCLLFENSADFGGGASSSTLINCTLTGNSASSGGGTAVCKSTNCIVYYNTANTSPEYLEGFFAYSCTTPFPSGSGNIPNAPLFINTSGWANLRLQSNSPCINAGNNAAVNSATDLDGNLRIASGSVDMGAYEFPNLFHFVRAANLHPVSPYDTWDTAATNIQDAIDAAQPGDTVRVEDGVYAFGGRAVYGTMTNRVAIDKAITVKSIDGPNYTFIVGQGVGEGGTNNGDGAIRCVYLANNAVLSGFTLTNGHTLTTGDTYAEQCGGGIFGEAGAVMTNCALIGNSAFRSGGGAFGGTLDHCALTRNLAMDSGGGVNLGTLNNCTLTGNWATYGGGAMGGTLTNCVLTDNSAYNVGGGACNAALNNCGLSGNSAISGGGGASGGTLNNCTLTGNSAAQGGGVLSAALNNCALSGNSAAYGGGANSCTLTNCTLSGNSAEVLGGGVCSATLNNCIVYYNTSGNGANHFISTLAYSCTTPLPEGAGNIDTDPLFIDTNGWANLRLQSNSPCIDAGSDDYVNGTNDLDGNPRISYGIVDMGAYEFQCPFRYVNLSNTTPGWPYDSWETAATHIQDAVDAAQPGATVLVTNGVYATGGRAVVGAMTNRVAIDKPITVQSVNGPSLTRIVGQGAGGTGTNTGDGAIRCAYVGINAVLSGFTLTNGHTRASGETYREWNGGGAWCEASGVLTNCILAGNSAYYVGGGTVNGILNNCTLSGNSAQYGGGAMVSALNNCTLTGNSAQYGGGGAYSCTLNNCILTGNSAPYNGGGASSCTLNNCTLAGNYGSGAYYGTMKNCIAYYNTGGNYSGSLTITYSCTTPLPEGTGSIDSAPLFVNTNGWVNLRLRAGSPCINAGNNASVSGSTDLDGNPRIVFDTVDMGAYEFDGAAHYVSTGNPTPAAPYLSWENAATNIQVAIDLAHPGDTVYVYKGTYDVGGRAVVGAMTNRIVIDKPITVQSYNGPEMTWIVGQGVGTDGTNNGDGAIRCAYVGTGAILSGFTLTNGHTCVTGDALKEQSGGGAWCETNAALVNCLLTGNTAKGRGGAVYMGFLTNCIVTGNLAASGGGSASAILVNCLISANAANTYGGGIYNGTLYNCTVAGNTSGTFGGGVYGATLTNSIVYYNTASINPNASSSTFAWSCTTPMPSGPGSTTNAPLFQNTNGWANLRLQFNSPCVNSGNTTFAIGTNDLDGNPRLFGATVDMGAYEHQGIDMGEYMVWLERYGLPTDGSANEIDSDLDGLNNYQEWRSGTNPTNAASVLRLTQLATNTITLQWPSVTGIRYTLQRSTNLSAIPAFQPLATNLLGTSNSITYTDTNPPPAPLYYRLGVDN
jgi:hypothetical protein